MSKQNLEISTLPQNNDYEDFEQLFSRWLILIKPNLKETSYNKYYNLMKKTFYRFWGKNKFMS